MVFILKLFLDETANDTVKAFDGVESVTFETP
jgi:hypothetical protein